GVLRNPLPPNPTSAPPALRITHPGIQWDRAPRYRSTPPAVVAVQRRSASPTRPAAALAPPPPIPAAAANAPASAPRSPAPTDPWHTPPLPTTALRPPPQSLSGRTSPSSALLPT